MQGEYAMYDLDNVPDSAIKKAGGKWNRRKNKKKKKEDETQVMKAVQTPQTCEMSNRPDLFELLEFAGYVREIGGCHFQADHGHHYRCYWTLDECQALVCQRKASEIQTGGGRMFVLWGGKSIVTIAEAKVLGLFEGWYHYEKNRKARELVRMDKDLKFKRGELWRLQEAMSKLYQSPTIREFREQRKELRQK